MDAKLFGLHSTGMKKPGRLSPQGKRLRDLREKVHGFSGHGGQKAFAEWLDIDPRRWNNFERGFPLSREIEDKLVAKTPGLSVEWLRHGGERQLSVELARKLDLIPESTSRAQRA